jgi:hypothetical protein
VRDNDLTELMTQCGVSCFVCRHLRPLTRLFFQDKAFRETHARCAASPQIVPRIETDEPLMYAAHARLFPARLGCCGAEGLRFSRRLTLLERAVALIAGALR